MDNKSSHISRFIDLILEEKIKQGDTVVDATLGLGRDSVKLAKLVGPKGKLIAFDIQEDAIKKSKDLFFLQRVPMDNVNLHLACHSQIDKYVKDQVDFAIMNLGYLPGSDKKVMTQAKTTIGFIEKTLGLLRPYGAMLISFYPGTDQGLEEMEEVMVYLKTIRQEDFNIIHLNFINQRGRPPELVVLEKIYG